jgi:cation:H+ antiporter
VIVGVEAALGGHGEVALGNVIGSNVANIGLILGSVALILPPAVHRSLRERELPVLIGTALAVPLFLLDGLVSRLEGALLLALAVAYTAWMIRAARLARVLDEARSDAQAAAEVADSAGAPRTAGALRSVGTAALGLAGLLFGGQLFVRAAVGVASAIGISDRVVGLTIVAVGTSLPEFVTSVIAARRGHADLAVGNVIGSNIFNVLLCLGASALAGAVAVPLSALTLDLIALIGMTALAALFIRTERTISRAEGAVVLALYAAFMAWLIVHG